MKIPCLILLLLLHINGSAINGIAKPPSPSDTVYICGSGKGKKYHLTAHCRGLSNCSAKAVKTTLKQATREGKTRCAWEK